MDPEIQSKAESAQCPEREQEGEAQGGGHLSPEQRESHMEMAVSELTLE